MIAWIIISLLLSALFSGLEIAFFTASKIRVEIDRNKGLRYARILSEFIDEPAGFISTLLIGNNIALAIFGAMMAQLLGPGEFGFLPTRELPLLLVQTLISTAIILLFGEFFPKSLFRIKPDAMLKVLAWPFRYIFYNLLRPLSILFSFLSKLIITRIFRLDYETIRHDPSAAELEEFIRQHSGGNTVEDGDDSEINTEIFERALYLKDVKVRECMVPRMEINAIDVNESLETLRNQFIETKHSRLVVYEESIDNIVGYTHHHELFRERDSIGDVLFPIPVVPATMNARDLLYLFTKERKSIARVVDEYGGTAGIVTLEDIIEEIFGEIEDEHDDEEYIEEVRPDGSFRFSGRLEIDYINDKYGLDLPAGEYETLAGLIMTVAEDLPEPGNRIRLHSYELTVVESTERRIETVDVFPVEDDPTD